MFIRWRRALYDLLGGYHQRRAEGLVADVVRLELELAEAYETILRQRAQLAAYECATSMIRNNKVREN